MKCSDGTFQHLFPGKFRKMMIEIGLMPSTIMSHFASEQFNLLFCKQWYLFGVSSDGTFALVYNVYLQLHLCLRRAAIFKPQAASRRTSSRSKPTTQAKLYPIAQHTLEYAAPSPPLNSDLIYGCSPFISSCEHTYLAAGNEKQCIHRNHEML